jgi:hypothetical protein
MKERFLANRKELLRLALPYQDIGRWIEPMTQNPGSPEESPNRGQ